MCDTGKYNMRAAIAGHLPLKVMVEVVEVKLNGVVVIMFCLHERARWVCWFDFVMVLFLFSSYTPAH
jgi:hypothetical protein